MSFFMKSFLLGALRRVWTSGYDDTITKAATAWSVEDMWTIVWTGLILESTPKQAPDQIHKQAWKEYSGHLDAGWKIGIRPSGADCFDRCSPAEETHFERARYCSTTRECPDVRHLFQ
ncbi:hypothetical protein QBC45DRAFT_429068 [Copromyces sp. CBS 386.78]|nr:hypothetical protein QBC45DRAFT_429068 [Copromyces sp. CBS 386.78]